MMPLGVLVWSLLYIYEVYHEEFYYILDHARVHTSSRLFITVYYIYMNDSP